MDGKSPIDWYGHNKKQLSKFNRLLIQVYFAIFIFCYSLSVVAAPPVAFDNWAETNGVISVDCPAGYTCESNVSSQGINVMTIIDPDGNRFFHQVITETQLDGTRTASESFVGKALQTDTLANSDGIALKQTISTTLDDSMNTSVLLNTGWSNDGAASSVDISQQLKGTTPNDEFEELFTFQADRDNTGAVLGHELDIWQRLRFISSNGATVDQNEFMHRQASGTRTPAAGSVTLPDGASLSWATGDSLRGSWVGQDCKGCSGATDNTVGALFSMQRFVNESDGELEVYTRNIFELQEPVWGNVPMDPPAFPR